MNIYMKKKEKTRPIAYDNDNSKRVDDRDNNEYRDNENNLSFRSKYQEQKKR